MNIQIFFSLERAHQGGGHDIVLFLFVFRTEKVITSQSAPKIMKKRHQNFVNDSL